MGVIRQLSKVALVALAALLAVSGALALLFGAGVGGLATALSPSGAAAGVFAVALLSGAIPALVIAPPVYLHFWRSRRATWPMALVAGIVLGATVGLLLDPALVAYSTPAGIAVAALTHAGASRWLGPPRPSSPAGVAR